MKFLIVIFLSLFLTSNISADNIEDYEVMGMSVGDSLLLHYDEKKIIKANRYDHTNTSWNNDKMFQLRMPGTGPYTEIMFALKKDDKDYIIYAISGLEKMANNISECYPKLKKITKEFEKQFPNAYLQERVKPHSGDKSKKSTVTSSTFFFDNGDFVSASCYDWTKKMKYWDNFRITITTKEFDDWLIKSYKK